MATYRLMDGLAGRPGNGPALTPYTATPFQAGLLWYVTRGGMWLQGFWWWVPAGGDTAPQKFCVWAPVSATAAAAVLVPGTTVMSGTLTANAWNWVPLAAWVPVSIGSTYAAATAWQPAKGFPDTANQFGPAQPYAAGITNGPLSCWADGPAGGSPGAPYGFSQGLFGTTSADPTAGMPSAQSSSSNFGIDIQVSDTPPPRYTGSYRLWPSNFDANPAVDVDTNVNYDLATEIHLSEACTLDKIWFFSPPTAVNLPTAAQVWSIATGTRAASNPAPTWSGAAGSKWVSCSFSGVVLPAGQYKFSVYDANGTAGVWGPKSLFYWNAEGQGAEFFVSAGVNGITSGPLTAPQTTAAAVCFDYDGAAGGATPPFSAGTTEPGQCSFGQLPGGGDTYPELYVAALAQNYWVDAEVTPLRAAAGGAYPYHHRGSAR